MTHSLAVRILASWWEPTSLSPSLFYSQSQSLTWCRWEHRPVSVDYRHLKWNLATFSVKHQSVQRALTTFSVDYPVSSETWQHSMQSTATPVRLDNILCRVPPSLVRFDNIICNVTPSLVRLDNILCRLPPSGENEQHYLWTTAVCLVLTVSDLLPERTAHVLCGSLPYCHCMCVYSQLSLPTISCRLRANQTTGSSGWCDQQPQQQRTHFQPVFSRFRYGFWHRA